MHLTGEQWDGGRLFIRFLPHLAFDSMYLTGGRWDGGMLLN